MSILKDEPTSEENAHRAVLSFLHPSLATNAQPGASENVKLLLSRPEHQQDVYQKTKKKRSDIGRSCDQNRHANATQT